MKKYIYIWLVVLLAFTACQKVLIGSVPVNTPTANFEEMWRGYQQWYGMFGVRNINWDSLHAIYRPQVHDKLTTEELYGILCQLITPLNDIHAFLQPTTHGLPRYESSTFFRNNTVQKDFSIRLIREKYLPAMVTIDTNLHYGMLPGKIGYIHFGEFGMPVSFYANQLKQIMFQLGDAKSLIIDIRNHGGGDDQVSRYIASQFAAERKLFMTVRKRNGPNPGDFGNMEEWYVDPVAGHSFLIPVVLLTTRWTASAGETFTWAMNTQGHVTQMGDTTAGGFTDIISRELPNGWLYFVGVGDFRNANGISEEGIGVAPRVYITNLPADIEAGNDKVLEAAIEKLR